MDESKKIANIKEVLKSTLDVNYPQAVKQVQKIMRDNNLLEPKSQTELLSSEEWLNWRAIHKDALMEDVRKGGKILDG